jgi:glutaredoxin
METDIIVYHQPGCAPCHRAIEFLRQRRIPFVAKDVTTDEKAAEELTDLGSMSTPTIVVGGQVLVGFDPRRLLELAQGRARLDRSR